MGDILDDVEAGRWAGCRKILIDNGNETEWQVHSHWRLPVRTASALSEAARFIIAVDSRPIEYTPYQGPRGGCSP